MPDKRIRLIFLVLLLLAVFVTVPYFLLRASGYRFDTDTLRFVPTGAIAVRAVPIGSEVTISGNDFERSKAVTAFSSTAFFPDLLPGTYHVSATLPGRQSWQKSADVTENQTTAFSFVRLFPESIPEPIAPGQAPAGITPSPDGSEIAIFTDTSLAIRETLSGEERVSGLSDLLLGDIAEVRWLGVERLLVTFRSGVSAVIGGLVGDLPVQLVPLPGIYERVVPVDQRYLIARTSQGLIEKISLPEDPQAPLPAPLPAEVMTDNTLAMALHGESVAYLDSGGILWIHEVETDDIRQRTVIAPNVPGIDQLIASRHGTGYLIIDRNKGAWLAAHDSEQFVPIAEGIESAQFSFDNKKLLLIGSREVSLYALEDRIEQPARKRGSRETITRMSDMIIEAEFLTPEEEHIVVQTPSQLTIFELDLRGGHNAWAAQNVTAYSMQNSPARLFLGRTEGGVSIIPIPLPGLLSQLLL